MFHIAIIESIHPEAIKLIENEKKFSYELIENIKEGDLIKKIQNCDAISLRTVPLTSKIINNCNNLKIVSRHGVGYDNVDLLAAKNKNILVCNVPDYGTEEVADHKMGMLLSLFRGLPEYARRVKHRNYSRKNNMPARLRGNRKRRNSTSKDLAEIEAIATTETVSDYRGIYRRGETIMIPVFLLNQPTGQAKKRPEDVLSCRPAL